MAYKSSPRGSRPVSLIVLHTAEGARDARSLAAYFWRDDIQASSHVAIDGRETLQLVPYDRAAWTVRSGNPVSDNAELCGFARWTREQWLSTGVVDGVTNPKAMLDRASDWVRSRVLARGIPARKITPAEVARWVWGVIGHVDWTLGMHDGTHTDPGQNFPWDYVIERAAGTDGLDMLTKQDIADAQVDALNRFVASKEAPRFNGRNVGDSLIEDTRQAIATNEKLDQLKQGQAEVRDAIKAQTQALTDLAAAIRESAGK